MTRHQQYYAANKNEINRRRREQRKSPAARAKAAEIKRAWRADKKWERKITEILGVKPSQARDMIASI